MLQELRRATGSDWRIKRYRHWRQPKASWCWWKPRPPVHYTYELMVGLDCWHEKVSLFEPCRVFSRAPSGQAQVINFYHEEARWENALTGPLPVGIDFTTSAEIVHAYMMAYVAALERVRRERTAEA